MRQSLQHGRRLPLPSGGTGEDIGGGEETSLFVAEGGWENGHGVARLEQLGDRLSCRRAGEQKTLGPASGELADRLDE
jgi:hypothetical protein